MALLESVFMARTETTENQDAFASQPFMAVAKIYNLLVHYNVHELQDWFYLVIVSV